MADKGITQDEMELLGKELKQYFKNNKWARRDEMAKTLRDKGVDLPGGETLRPSDQQITELLSEPLLPSEKRVGKVIVSGSGNKQTTVFLPEDDIEGRLYYGSDAKSVSYRISEDGYDGGYKVERVEPGKFIREVKNMPSKKWAVAYAVRQLDRTQPAPPKFTDREKLMSKEYTFHPLSGSVSDAVEKYGNWVNGVAFSDKDASFSKKLSLMYGGKANGVFADGFMLIVDKKAADDINDYFIKKDARVAGKVNQKYIDDNIAEYKDKFPKYQELIPKDDLKEWYIVGFGNLKSGLYGGPKFSVAYLSSGSDVAAIDVNRLAALYSHVSGINKIESAGWDKPFRFSVDGKVVAVVMPIFADKANIPAGKIADAVKRVFGTRPRISKYKSIKGKGKEVVEFTDGDANGIPMQRSDVYKALVAQGRSKTWAKEDAFEKNIYKTTDAAPVDYADYRQVAKLYRDREQAIIDEWDSGMMRHEKGPEWKNEITKKMRQERDEIRQERTAAFQKLVDKASRSKSLDVDLESAEQSRSPRSRESDERQSNALTIEPDDPRVKQWLRDPGRMDVAGIDTPKKPNKKQKKSAKKAVRKHTTVGKVKR